MVKKTKFEVVWEESPTDNGVSRSKTIGGWLVCNEPYLETPSGITFIPDPKHEWEW